MRRLCTAFALVFGLATALPSAALAQDFDDDDDEILFEGEEEEAAPERMEEGDDLGAADEQEAADDSLEDFEDSEEAGDELTFEDEAPPADASSDSAAIFRQTQDDVAGSPPDEEIQVWEQYLSDHPDTPFRERITRRIADLEQEMYDSGIGIEVDRIDAMSEEIKLALPLQVTPVDPRTRFTGGVEWGIPAYINLFLDYEHAFSRAFSGHVGARRQYTGYNVEFGTKMALVKSTRTNTLVTLITDAHFNTIPSWLGIRPQLGFGKRFGKIDLTATAGADLELRDPAGVRVIGGISTTYAASDTVRMFAETNWNMKGIGRDGGFYRFNIISFGMKFFPGKTDDQKTEVNMGATVPYSTNYWQYHYGSVMVQANRYLD